MFRKTGRSTDNEDFQSEFNGHQISINRLFEHKKNPNENHRGFRNINLCYIITEDRLQQVICRARYQCIYRSF